MKINKNIILILLLSLSIGCNLFSKNDNSPTSNTTSGSTSGGIQTTETTGINYQTTNITTDTSYQTTNIMIDSTSIDTTIAINIIGFWYGTYKDVEASDSTYIMRNGQIEFNIQYWKNNILGIKHWEKTLSGGYQSDGFYDSVTVTGNLITQTETESGTYDLNNRKINATITRKFIAIVNNGVMKGTRDSTVNGTYTDSPYENYQSYWKMEFSLTR